MLEFPYSRIALQPKTIRKAERTQKTELTVPPDGDAFACWLLNYIAYDQILAHYPGMSHVGEFGNMKSIQEILKACNTLGLPIDVSHLTAAVDIQSSTHYESGTSYEEFFQHIAAQIAPEHYSTFYSELIERLVSHRREYLAGVASLGDCTSDPEPLLEHYLAEEIVGLEKLLKSHHLLRNMVIEEVLTGGSGYFLNRCGLQVAHRFVDLQAEKMPYLKEEGGWGSTFLELLYKYTYKVRTVPELFSAHETLKDASHGPSIRDLHHLGFPMAFIEWFSCRIRPPPAIPYVRIYSRGSIGAFPLPADNAGEQSEITNLHNTLIWLFADTTGERLRRYLHASWFNSKTTGMFKGRALPFITEQIKQEIEMNSAPYFKKKFDYSNEISPEDYETFKEVVEEALRSGCVINPLVNWAHFNPEMHSIYQIPRHMVLVHGLVDENTWMVYDPSLHGEGKNVPVSAKHVWESLANGRFNVVGTCN